MDRSLRLLLVVCLLAATLSPPVIVHAHEAGETSHQHEHRGSAATADPHRDQFAWRGDHLHRHVFAVFLGSSYYVPVSHPSAESEQQSLRTCVGTAVTSSLAAPEARDRSMPPPPALRSPAHEPAALRAGGQTSAVTVPVGMAFLCDRARHERSGVLLA
jgi:hypothetical protein